MRSLGLDYDSLRGINPGLIQTSITPFGQTGSYRDYKAYHLNTYHSGLGYVTPGNAPSLDKEPLKTGGFVGEYAAGLTAAVAIMAALYWKGKTGRGQFIDISKQEALINLQRVRAVTYPNSGKVFTRLAVVSGTGGLIECKDGYVFIASIMGRSLVNVILIFGLTVLLMLVLSGIVKHAGLIAPLLIPFGALMIRWLLLHFLYRHRVFLKV